MCLIVLKFHKDTRNLGVDGEEYYKDMSWMLDYEHHLSLCLHIQRIVIALIIRIKTILGIILYIMKLPIPLSFISNPHKGVSYDFKLYKIL